MDRQVGASIGFEFIQLSLAYKGNHDENGQQFRSFDLLCNNWHWRHIGLCRIQAHGIQPTHGEHLHRRHRICNCRGSCTGDQGCGSVGQSGGFAFGQIPFAQGPWSVFHHSGHRRDSLLDRHARDHHRLQSRENPHQRYGSRGCGCRAFLESHRSKEGGPWRGRL